MSKTGDLSTLQYQLFQIMMAFTLAAPLTLLNKVFFSLMFLLFLGNIQIHTLPVPKTFVAAILGLVLIFIYGWVVALAKGGCDLELAAQISISILLIFSAIIIIGYQLPAEKIIIKQAVFFSSVCFLYAAANIYQWRPILDIFENINAPRDPQREFFGLSMPTYSLISAPFLLLPWTLLIIRIRDNVSLRDVMSLSVVSLAIIISGRRALYVVMFVFLALIAVGSLRRSARVVPCYFGITS
jgi:hypothetical protein